MSAGLDAFRRRAAHIAAKAGPDMVIVTYSSSDSREPRELVAPEDCDHVSGWCNDGDDFESSGCHGCGMTRNRADCGEVDEQTESLDRLDVTIREHPMAGSARQWRLIAADLIAELNTMDIDVEELDDILARVRQQHDQRTIIPKG
ncbi:hypothetical protein EOG37_01260 [Clavibacter michiganensis subsp. michiganensis]|uniref:hypothetical protein n=1 Tax=Clavibacter michiganensis TaxID=28447 RepID=UPI001C646601|nr:hypothetical protein [Clavibacter michiganensis]MBW8025308.1 hypothetical protein [Clavibacter michiganensis subsp. michiganensis]